jgi:hypothetical protein
LEAVLTKTITQFLNDLCVCFTGQHNVLKVSNMHITAIVLCVMLYVNYIHYIVL